ncbi:MAG: hypothetical protein HUK05_03970 [Prevotella sp.]|nr:hypothetical protein [Prevotella sp.]
MKKSLFLVGLAFIAGLTFVSCDNKKAAADVEEQASVLTDSVKAQVIELFKTVKVENDQILQEIEVLPEGVRVLPVKYFIPLDWTDKAQTLEQKCALLGCYAVDAQFDKLLYDKRNDYDARRVVVTKLVAETNIADEELNLDSLDNLDRETYIKALQDISLKNFESALANDQADNQVTVLLYSLVETTLNAEYANEQRGEYDQLAMIKDLKKSEKAMTSMVQLIEKLSPYYESLKSFLPVTEKIKAVLDAKDEAEKDEAYLAYNNYIKELRGKLNAQVGE